MNEMLHHAYMKKYEKHVTSEVYIDKDVGWTDAFRSLFQISFSQKLMSLIFVLLLLPFQFLHPYCVMNILCCWRKVVLRPSVEIMLSQPCSPNFSQPFFCYGYERARNSFISKGKSFPDGKTLIAADKLTHMEQFSFPTAVTVVSANFRFCHSAERMCRKLFLAIEITSLSINF